MDWSDERYVRLYTRDTADWVSWPWQSRVLLPLLTRKCDRVGRIGMGRGGHKTLAALLLIPEKIVKIGLEGLLHDGCVVQDGQLLMLKNFQEAQEAIKSDAIRQRERRDRERLKTMESMSQASRDVTHVTKRHAESRESRNVTPSSSTLPIPSSTLKDSSPAFADDPPPVKKPRRASAHSRQCDEVLAYYASELNQLPKFDAPDYGLIGKALKKLTVSECKQVVDGAKLDDWAKRPGQLKLGQLFGTLDQCRHFISRAPHPAPTSEAVPSVTPPLAGTEWRRIWDEMQSMGASPHRLMQLSRCREISNNGVLVIEVPSVLMRDQIEDHLGPQLEMLAGRPVKLEAALTQPNPHQNETRSATK